MSLLAGGVHGAGAGGHGGVSLGGLELEEPDVDQLPSKAELQNSATAPTTPIVRHRHVAVAFFITSPLDIIKIIREHSVVYRERRQSCVVQLFILRKIEKNVFV